MLFWNRFSSTSNHNEVILTIFSSLLLYPCSPVESSRFGSSGNLSQTSSQLSETGQESTGGSELEESFHSYHSTGIHPSTNGQPRTNGSLLSNGEASVGKRDKDRLSPEVERGLKKDPLAERASPKLQRYIFCSIWLFICHIQNNVSLWHFHPCTPGFMMMGNHYLSPHPEFVGWRPLVKWEFSSGR